MLITSIMFLLLCLFGAPIAFVLGISSVPYLLITGKKSLMTIIPQLQFVGLDNFLILAAPFFLLASNLMNEGGITVRIINFTNKIVGHIRGGLGHVAVVTSMIFAGLTGTAMSDAAAVGGILIPALKKEGYHEEFVAALIASASTTGPIIPPSFLFVLYSLVAGGVSVAALFIAGIIPGIMIGVANMILVGIYAYRRGLPKKKRATIKEMVITLFQVLPAALVPIVMIGGLVGGVFTATEAACAAVITGLIVGFVFIRDFKFTKESLGALFKIIVNTGVTVGSLLYILAGASILAWVLTNERVPHQIAQGITMLSSNPVIILMIINIFLLIVGCFMDPTPSMLILAPILLPLVLKIGIHPVHFGVMITLNLVIGLTTPPVGGCLFVVSAITKLSIERISRAIWPFLIANTTVLFIITYVPWTCMFLPNLLLR
jgi:tripartite ATP-independent transporter DctM subunit